MGPSKTSTSVACILLLACGSTPMQGPGDAGGSARGDSRVVPRDAGPIVVGDPGCGLERAAFCETFDAPSSDRGRAGELAASRFSLGRSSPQMQSAYDNYLPVGPATLPPCRVDQPARVFPPEDSLVCDPVDAVRSRHLLVSVGAQNYGQNSYRVRQPFDFADRTGTIVFDAEAYVLGTLFGWISVSITEDPTPIPSFAQLDNDEGGAVPRNAIEMQFASNCPTGDGFALRFIDVVRDYEEELHQPPQWSHCVPAEPGKLNHFEIRISQARVEVWASPASSDGVTFDAAEMIYATDVDLPFTRGYVHFTTHNHATLKYSEDTTFGATHSIDAWTARWDNLGFDGPVLSGWREHEVADSLVPGENGWNIGGPVMAVGYAVPDADGGRTQSFRLENVDPSGMTRARIALAMWYDITRGGIDQFALGYRLNGGAWHERPLTPGERRLMTSGRVQGALSQMLEIALDELVPGTNTLELVTRNVPQSAPPVAANIDLVLSAE
jgi:hypothetical protein